MNYIVLDLEWNQSKSNEVKRNKVMPVEIIEIGAVKLDEKLNIVSSFNRYVKPQVYTAINPYIEDIINVDMKKVSMAESFPAVFEKFMSWCGEDIIFCTWGNMDLTELQRNMTYHKIKYEFPKPFIYYDIQKLYSIDREDGKTRKTLEAVIKDIGIKSRTEFHNALNDAHYTAMVCKKIDFEKVKGRYSIDCYLIPDNKDEEIYARYDTYEKFISRGFATREGVMTDGNIRKLRCYECGKECNVLVDWFPNCNKILYCAGKCNVHGFIKGRLKIKKSDNDKYYAIRVLKLTDEAGVNKVLKKKNDK